MTVRALRRWKRIEKGQRNRVLTMGIWTESLQQLLGTMESKI